ncbi:arsenic metallochaperone ArsD family protein [Micromonospora sp. NPDC049101]|uniref:arsenic metallochaperone ArsD family protein n=1 Tax=unclassified Micromonospora TaxID=2617518 RepID=UPI0033CC5695
MAFHVPTIEQDLRLFTEVGLLATQEAEQVVEVISEVFPFVDAMGNAESIHVHVNADDLTRLPNEEALARACQETSNSEYERKFSFASGLNVIFATEPTAQDEFIPGAVNRVKPYVDHLGVDLREESDATKLVFEAIPGTAARAGWRHVYQDGPVRCCYTEMGPKHWVYPPEGSDGTRRPIEFAFGDLRSSDEHLGCDYRPIDPAHPLAAQVSAMVPGCGTPSDGVVSGAANASEQRQAVSPAKIYVFEECSCNTAPSQPLLNALRERYDTAEIQAFDMAKPVGLLPLPPALFFALEAEGSRCLPALVVDGALRTQGWLPTATQAVQLIDHPDETQSPAKRPTATTDACCATDSSCC